jgi:hypothetical protein
MAQLNQNCTVSVLNRTVPVNADGTWVLPNVPANFGQVKARATCIQNGQTIFGESAFFTVAANGAVNLPAITLGSSTPIPTSLAIAPVSASLTTAGQTVQLSITATYPDNSTRNLTAASTGTNYTISNTAIATITADGLVTAVSSGTVVIQADNDGATAIGTVSVALGGATVGGIPVSYLLAHGLNPNDPLVAQEDPDRDGLTNLQEFQLGTDPNNPDTDGDGLSDGDEVNKYHTSPLLADTDGDGIPDGVEIQTGTNPLDRGSYDLKKATATSVLLPPSFSLTTSQLLANTSVQLSWKVNLIDGKTTLDLTADPRTSYSSSNLAVCNFGLQPGLIFAGGSGGCAITISQSTLSITVPGTVQSFAPTALSFIAIPGFANNVKVKGNFAYVAAGSAGLQVVDVTDRSNPKIVSSLALTGNANDLRVAGNTVYVAAGSSLLTIDVTNPLLPKFLGSVNIPDVAWDVVLAGNLAYVAAGSAGLQIVNVSNLTSPAIVGSLAIPGGTAKGVAITGNLVVIAASSAGVVVASVANAASPQLLGSVATPGDARKVAVNRTAAFIADYPVSMQVVDFSNPSSPQIIASTSDPLGGKLQDVAVLSVAGSTFTFGADVFFVNGVPIVDVTVPDNPVPRSILNFASYRDDNGHGIAVDGQFVYMTGEEGTVSDLGTSGDTRLYIGQYNQFPQDSFGIPPTIQISSPTASPLIQGQTVTLSANATDDVAVASVTLQVNGQGVFTTTTPPYQTSYIVPANATSLTLGGTAIDYGNNIGTAQNIQLQVIPDPGTTVTGRVVDSGGIPVSGATVSTIGSRSSATAADGSFSITQVPTVVGNVQVTATFITSSNTTLAGQSITVPPVRLGITNVGTIMIVPYPVITSISPKSALAGNQLTMTVNGTTLTGATFVFQPAASTPIAIQVASTNSGGTQATLTLTVPATAIGTFALVATNSGGNSGATATQVDRFTVVDPNSTADTDHDGFQDVIEAVFGTDPLDPSSFPIIQPARETESVAFSLLNAPVTGAGIRETESVAFSLLNAPVTGAGIRETESIAFSILNAPITGAGIRETESVAFSLLNAPVSGAGTRETEAVPFSVQNTAVGVTDPAQRKTVIPSSGGAPSGSAEGSGSRPQNAVSEPMDPFLDSDGDGLPDWFEILIGTDPFNADTDGDGLTDFQEVFIHHTNPLKADTDGDGFTDGEEVRFGSDPLDPNSTPLNARKHVAAVPRNPVELAKSVRDDDAKAADGIASKATIEGDAHVKSRPRKQKREKAGSREGNSPGAVPRANR